MVLRYRTDDKGDVANELETEELNEGERQDRRDNVLHTMETQTIIGSVIHIAKRVASASRRYSSKRIEIPAPAKSTRMT